MNTLKNLWLLLVLMSFSFTVYAQQVTEGNQPFMKKETANALSIIIQGQPKNVEDVLDKKFKGATNTRGRTSRGLTTYEGARYSRLSVATLDYFYRVEKAGKRNDALSRVVLFLSTGNNNFISSDSHPEEIVAATEMLEGLQLEVNIYELELVIGEQNKVIEKSIREHEKMVRDSVNLEHKLAETLKDIEENKINRANQLVQIDEEKMKLLEMEAELERLKNGEPILPEQEPAVIDEEKKIEIEDEGGTGGGQN